MEMKGFSAVVACFISSIHFIVSSEYQLTSDLTCDVSEVLPFPGPVRSVLQCAVGCLKKSNGSNLCYNNGTSTCTCCSATNPSGRSTNKCYRRKVPCPDGWTMAGWLCLLVHSELIEFTECKNMCDDSGGKILRPENPEQISDALMALEGNQGPLSNGKSQYWLGLVANTTERYRPWYDSGTGTLVTYFNWSPEEPGGTPLENCVHIETDAKWYDLQCFWTRACVCQI